MVCAISKETEFEILLEMVCAILMDLVLEILMVKVIDLVLGLWLKHKMLQPKQKGRQYLIGNELRYRLHHQHKNKSVFRKYRFQHHIYIACIWNIHKQLEWRIHVNSHHSKWNACRYIQEGEAALVKREKTDSIKSDKIFHQNWMGKILPGQNFPSKSWSHFFNLTLS